LRFGLLFASTCVLPHQHFAQINARFCGSSKLLMAFPLLKSYVLGITFCCKMSLAVCWFMCWFICNVNIFLSFFTINFIFKKNELLFWTWWIFQKDFHFLVFFTNLKALCWVNSSQFLMILIVSVSPFISLLNNLISLTVTCSAIPEF